MGEEKETKPSTPAVIGPRPQSGIQVAALVLSLLGLVIGISAPIGMILGFVTLKEKPNTLAIISIVVGGAITAIGLLGIVAAIILVSMAGGR